MLTKREIEFSIRKAEPGVWGEAKLAPSGPPPPSGGTDPSQGWKDLTIREGSWRDGEGSGRDGGGSGGDGGGSGRDRPGMVRDRAGMVGEQKTFLFRACGAPRVNTCVLTLDLG